MAERLCFSCDGMGCRRCGNSGMVAVTHRPRTVASSERPLDPDHKIAIEAKLLADRTGRAFASCLIDVYQKHDDVYAAIAPHQMRGC